MKQTRLRIAPGWYAVAGAICIAALVAGWDWRLKQAPHAGYRPEAAVVTAYCEDFPVFLRRLAETPAYAAVRAEAHRPLKEVELAVRLAAGVRPAPLRLEAWLGGQVLAARGEGRWGVCVRPGLFLRVAHGLNRLLSQESDAGGAFRFSCKDGRPPVYYAWRDGFLIASPWAAYVREAMAGPPHQLDPELSGAPEVLWLAWARPAPGALGIDPAGAVGLSGKVAIGLPEASGALLFSDAWEEPPLLMASAHRPKNLLALAAPLWSAVQSSGYAAPVKMLAGVAAAAWPQDALPAQWAGNVVECAFVLFDIDGGAGLPVPEAALALRRGEVAGEALEAHPLWPLALGAVPYAWGGHAGVIAPFWGEQWSLCLSKKGDFWLAASQEPLMARLLARGASGAPLDADVALLFNWTKAGAVLKELARRGADLGLIARPDHFDAPTPLLSLARALEGLGALRLTGRSHAGHLDFEGHLAVAPGRTQ